MDGSLAEPEQIAVTVAVLSDLKRIVWPRQWRPHSAAATTTGTISLAAMLIELHDSGHCTWNHSWGGKDRMAPHPHLPDASDMQVREGDSGGHKEVPFHVEPNSNHHVRSARHCWERRTKW